jgi:S1-C subfamily serine protease
MRLAERNDETGLWDFTELADPLPAEPSVPCKADFIQPDQPAAAKIVPSFVRVSYTTPVQLDGYLESSRDGFGLVIDSEKGLVMVSRAIILSDLGDISVTVADTIIVSGKVVFRHPLQNYAIIRYDSSLVKATVHSAQLSTDLVKQGAETLFVGFDQNFDMLMAKTTVTNIANLAIQLNTSVPRYRATHIDAIDVDTHLGNQCPVGVLISEDGVVQAMWLNYLDEHTEYHFGLATPSFLPIVTQIQKGTLPKLRIMGIETVTVPISQACTLGVSKEWIEKVAVANPSRHQLFMVRKVDCPLLSPNSRSLEEGDVILTLNGQLMTRVSEFDIMYDQETLNALIVRNGKEIVIEISTISTADLETDRALIFCGAVLQRPHRAVRQLVRKLPSEVYVSVKVCVCSRFVCFIKTTDLFSIFRI